MGKVFHIIIGQLRGILVWFDSIVYGLIPTLYKLMLYLANIDLVSDNVPIQGLIRRIYILIGVFMLFKLSFSVLSYIIDPDAFSDQTKGFSNLVKRVIIAVVLLVSIPWIFQEAYVIQGKILTSGILPGIVLGEPSHYSDADGKDDLEKTVETSAKDVQFLLFGPFYSIDYNNEDFKEACTPDAENPSKHILGTIGMASSEECLNAVADSMDNDDTVVASGINIRDFFRNTEDGGEDLRNFSSFGGLASWSTTDGEFAINYMPVISTLCGGYLVFLLLSFCIDVAARIIRLLFLQILSPVAVISSIDPTTSGDRLKEWAKECFKTWVSLFLRLLVVFLIIQLVRVITNTVYSGAAEIAVEGYSNKNGINAWIYIFLILGIFSAAKKVPELIEKATGIKMSGELQLNPFKALSENAGVGTFIGGAIGAGATSLASGATAIANGKGFLGTAKSTLTGFGVGALRGARGGFGKNMTEAIKAGAHSGGISSRNMLMRKDLNIDWLHHPFKSAKKSTEMFVTGALDKAGGPTPYQMLNSKASRYEAVVEQADSLQDAIKENSEKSKAMINGMSFEDRFKMVDDTVTDAKNDFEHGVIDMQAYRTAMNQAESNRKILQDAYYKMASSGQLRMTDPNDPNATIHIDDFDIITRSKELSDRLVDAGVENRQIDSLSSIKDRRNESYIESEKIKNNDSYQEFEHIHKERENITKESFYENRK